MWPIYCTIFPFCLKIRGILCNFAHMNAKNTDVILNIEQIRTLETHHDGWACGYGNDFYISHNPLYSVQYDHPYMQNLCVALICHGGYATGAVDLQPYRLNPGTMLIVLPGQIMQGYEMSPDFKGTYIFMSEAFLLGLNIGEAYRFHSSIEKNPCIPLDERLSRAIQGYIDMCRSLIEIADINPNTYESIQLLTRLFFLSMGWFLHRDTTDTESNNRQSDVMNQFLQQLKIDFKRHRDVEHYASKLNLTPKYMSALVKNASGKPALQWIEEKVIIYAKAQLASGRFTVKQLTYDLNFPNQSFFGRYFKRLTGMSPTEYKDSVRKTK